MVDFLIIGTSRAGTTTLYHYLKKHPNIYMPDIKELWFFGSELKDKNKNRYFHASNLQEYELFFSNAKNNQLKGEITPGYLYSKDAFDEIYNYNKNMKIIVIFRHPVDYIISAYNKNQTIINNKLIDFNTFLKLQDVGQLTMDDTHFLTYLDMVNYSKYLKNYINKFPAKNIKIIIFDDLVEKPTDVFNDLFSFLGVPPIKLFDNKLSKINESTSIRSIFLQKLIRDRNTMKSVKNVLKIIIPSQNIKNKIYMLLDKMNQSKKKYDPPYEEKRKLQQKVNKYIIEFEQLINRDLTMWKNKYK